MNSLLPPFMQSGANQPPPPPTTALPMTPMGVPAPVTSMPSVLPQGARASTMQSDVQQKMMMPAFQKKPAWLWEGLFKSPYAEFAGESLFGAPQTAQTMNPAPAWANYGG